MGRRRRLEVSELPVMSVTSAGPNSRAVRTGQVIITNDYMSGTGQETVIVGPVCCTAKVVDRGSDGGNGKNHRHNRGAKLRRGRYQQGTTPR
jgi:hypothetical protein